MKETIPLKGRIIEESLKLFSVKGYMSTSTTDIIQAADTSKGGFYNHFRSKEQLFLETLSAARKIWREKNFHGVEGAARPLEKIRIILENYRDRYLADSHNFPGGCIFVNLAIELSDQAPALAVEVNEGFVRLKGMIRRLLDEEKAAGGIPASTNTESVEPRLHGAARRVRDVHVRQVDPQPGRGDIVAHNVHTESRYRG